MDLTELYELKGRLEFRLRMLSGTKDAKIHKKTIQEVIKVIDGLKKVIDGLEEDRDD